MPPKPIVIKGDAKLAKQSEGNEYFKVEKGQFTFDREGNEGGRYHSRKPHCPSKNSGVTIGRGYDLKERNSADVAVDFSAVGISGSVIERLLPYVGKQCDANCIREVKSGLSDIEITPQQQKDLFERDYPRYEAGVRQKIGADHFDSLPQVAQDVITSLYYNSPSLIGPKLIDAIQRKDWDAAEYEIRSRSNKFHDQATQDRREMEAQQLRQAFQSDYSSFGVSRQNAAVVMADYTLASNPRAAAVAEYTMPAQSSTAGILTGLQPPAPIRTTEIVAAIATGNIGVFASQQEQVQFQRGFMQRSAAVEQQSAAGLQAMSHVAAVSAAIGRSELPAGSLSSLFYSNAGTRSYCRENTRDIQDHFGILGYRTHEPPAPVGHYGIFGPHGHMGGEYGGRRYGGRDHGGSGPSEGGGCVLS